jgi:hypothetical protein
MIVIRVTEFTIILVGKNMKESGKKINSMDREDLFGLMVMCMRVILSME